MRTLLKAMINHASLIKLKSRATLLKNRLIPLAYVVGKNNNAKFIIRLIVYNGGV